MIRVLFVCTGNICRSPMAEAVFSHLVNQAGLSEFITCDSAGTDAYHAGDSPHPGTIRILLKHGISYSGISRLLTRDDLSRFDYVIAMDDEHMHDIHRLNRPPAGCKIARLLDYAPEVPEREVPDPYYNGKFEHVYQLVLAGSMGLLAQIRAEHNLP